MNNESNYLNDKSNNDYQLIKEISEVIRDYKNKNKRVDRKFVDKVLNILLINNNIEVNKTKFVSNGYGSYDFVNKTIEINFQAVQSTKKEYKFLKLKDSNLYEYYLILHIILHEFTHAKQYEIINEGTKCEVSNIYRYCDDFLQNNYDLYNLHHDTVPYERFSDIRADYLTLEILKRVYDIKELWYFQYITLYNLLYNYNEKELYPLKKFSDLIESNCLPQFNHLIPDINIREDNLYERLNIGLPITEEEYNYLIEIEDYYLSNDNNDKSFNLSTALMKKKRK